MKSKRVPNSRKTAMQEFDLAWARLGQALIEAKMSHLVSWRNALTFQHGHGWEFLREDASTGRGGLIRSTADVDIEHQAQVNNDVVAYRAALNSFADQFVAQMSRRAYEAVSEAAEEVGNVVSAADAGSLPQAFLAMIEKVEFGVDESGQVTPPAIHASPEAADKMMRELAAQGPEFEKQVEAVTQRKKQEALDREAARLARYKKRG